MPQGRAAGGAQHRAGLRGEAPCSHRYGRGLHACTTRLWARQLQGPNAPALLPPNTHPPPPLCPCPLQRGVSAELGAYLLPLIHDKEQREYVGWLEQVAAFAAK